MLDIDAITETIAELENAETTFSTCEKLAALYTVLEHFSTPADVVQKELGDIMPQYQMYKQVKRRYKMGEVTEQAIVMAMHDTCKEISEFIQTLYSSTDIPQERDEIRQLIQELNGKY